MRAALLLAAYAAAQTDPAADPGVAAHSYTYEDYWPVPPDPCAQCEDGWIDDGECDERCNHEECDWDGKDCFHGASSCYTMSNGADYRGTMNITKTGKPCQKWSANWPHAHHYEAAAYPDSGLGGHNFCRNPEPGHDSIEPWCFTTEYETTWEYCEVGPVSSSGVCSHPRPIMHHTPKVLQFDQWESNHLYEHNYAYYALTIPKTILGVKIVLVPVTGDADLYLSFDIHNPNGHNYTYVQRDTAVDVFQMTRAMHGFCGLDRAPTIHAQEVNSPTHGACQLYFSVTAFETSDYHVVALNSHRRGGTNCAEGCEWKMIGDGNCQADCNVTACFWDRGDCARSADAGHCKADCKPDWISDGYCDDACFNEKCGWDGGDCGGDVGCADDCMPKSIGDGECDPECNNVACNHDGNDCFFGHHECYTREDGADYRGNIHQTESGHMCQRWSDQKPKAHDKTHDHYPAAGLGGHNYCRNPDGEPKPWCYPIDSPDRFQYCDVGPKSSKCPPPPPPPPMPAPAPPPGPVCSARCNRLGSNGVCDAPCNTTACLWDKARATPASPSAPHSGDQPRPAATAEGAVPLAAPHRADGHIGCLH